MPSRERLTENPGAGIVVDKEIPNVLKSSLIGVQELVWLLWLYFSTSCSVLRGGAVFATVFKGEPRTRLHFRCLGLSWEILCRAGEFRPQKSDRQQGLRG